MISRVRIVILAADAPTPQQMDLVFAAATDDVMIFSGGPAGSTLRAAKRLDQALSKAAVLRNKEKDVNDQLSATCVGVDLEDGVQLGYA